MAGFCVLYRVSISNYYPKFLFGVYLYTPLGVSRVSLHDFPFAVYKYTIVICKDELTIPPYYMLLISQKLVRIHKLNETKYDLCMPLYDICLGEISGGISKLSQFPDLCAFLFLLSSVLKANIILFLV